MSRPKTRIAPTPSGFLHLGNVFSFAITWALARQASGSIVLRIDNLDNARFRPEYVQDIFDTLSFLGIEYDEGPRSLEEFLYLESHPPRQHLCEALLSQLLEKGMLYACTCSRSQMAHTPEGGDHHVCLEQALPFNTPGAAWRVKIPYDMEVEFEDLLLGHVAVPLGKEMPDVIVRKKDHQPSYQIASLCEDIQMGCNLVVRGEDLLPSTATQLYLASLTHQLSFTHTTFVHHPLIKNAIGEKLSKSRGETSIQYLRKNGSTSQEIWGLISRKMGWEHPAKGADDFLERFRLGQLAGLAS